MTCSIPDCDNLAERNGICATHNREQRKAIKESLKPNKKPVRIKKVSDKMGEALKEYAKESQQFLLNNTKCAVYPNRPSTEVHHMKGRATIELLLDKRYWLPVSRPGHRRIELNPEWAKAKGFSLSRLATEPHKI